MKLTQWHDGSIKPVRSGLYERKIFSFSSILYLCYFSTGTKKWYLYGEDWQDAMNEFRLRNTSNRLVQWRGLAENPTKVKKGKNHATE